MRPTSRIGRGKALGLLVWACAGIILLSLPLVEAQAKVPGQTYCYKRVCHRVLTLAETEARVGRTSVAVASHYDDPRRDRFNPSNLTSSGELFRPDDADNAASPVFPNGTKLVVWHPRTGRAVVVRINNSGPYWKERTLDLSRAAAERIGLAETGVGAVHVRVVHAPTRAEASYRRGRSYPPVQGYLGQFASIDAAAVRAGSGSPAPVLVAAAGAGAVDGPFMADPMLVGEPVVADGPVTGFVLASTAPAAAAAPTIASAGSEETTIRIALVAARPASGPPAAVEIGQRRLAARATAPAPRSDRRVAEIERQAMREVMAMLARR